MKRIVGKIILTAVFGVFLLGCYPAGPEYVEDLDVVSSTHDEVYDFKGKATYSMPDKIVTDVKIDKGDTTYVYMKDEFAKKLLDRIKLNMKDLGWGDPIPKENNPDVLLTPAAISTTTYFYSYWYDWWYYGYGGYWGWYYPPYYTVSSYTTGTFIMTISDPNVDNPINKSPAVWIGAANGLLTYEFDENRVYKGIDQAFAQSPYLNTK